MTKLSHSFEDLRESIEKFTNYTNFLDDFVDQENIGDTYNLPSTSASDK